MRQKGDTGDARIAKIAARQHGVVSAVQLRGAGLSPSSISRRVRAGRLHRVHRGVYAVGHTSPSYLRRWMAAVLACGDGAVLSHRSAAYLWGLLAAQERPADVTIPGTTGRHTRSDILLHRSRTIALIHTTRRKGIPVTTPARTIRDLRRTAPPVEVRRAIRQTNVLGFRVDDEPTLSHTRSDLELAFLRLCRRHLLPTPEVNARIKGYEVDFFWRDRGLIVETDGYRYHRGRQAFEEDRERDLTLRSLGFEVMRFSYRQVTEQGDRVAGLLRARLAS